MKIKVPFRKSHIFSGTTRRNQNQEREERAEARKAEQTRPAYVQVPRMMDDIEKFGKAEKILNEQGILPPKNPHPADRMQCAPNWTNVVDSVAKGIEQAEAMGEAIGRSNSETAADAGFFAVVYGGIQFVKESLDSQNCMNKQDEKYDRELDEYVGKVKAFADTMDSVEMVTEKVEITNPLHPKYQRPITHSWNSQQSTRDWGINFNTNGRTHSGGITWRF
jgi:hypothetical protein